MSTRTARKPPRPTKKYLHRLVDELPQGEVVAASRMLEYLRDMGDPLLRKLREAPEGEPLSPEEEAALAEAEEDERAGRILSHEEAKRYFLEHP